MKKPAPCVNREKVLEGLGTLIVTVSVGMATVPVDVIESVLGIVLGHDDARLRPEPAPRDGLDHHSEGQIVVGDHRSRRGGAGARTVRVVGRQEQVDEVRELPLPLELA